MEKQSIIPLRQSTFRFIYYPERSVYTQSMKHFLHHLFFPHSSNNHRAKLLHHDALLVAIALIFAAFVFIQGTYREYPAVLGDKASVSTEDLLRYTNMQREANGLKPLTLNQQLSKAAQLKAEDMFAKDYWAHVSPDGTTPWVFIKKSGYDYLYAGENLARGYDTSASIVDAWMHSPTHRDNLLSSNYTDIGFAIQTGSLLGSDTVLVVQEFGSPYTVQNLSNGNTGNASPASPKIVPIGDYDTAGNKPLVANASTKVQNQPLFDLTSFQRNFSFFFLIFFIGLLAIDALIVERKQIARLFSHNTDHMLFLVFVLLAGILIGKGLIL